MEYMKIDGFFGAVISSIINKAAEKKLGKKPNIDISHLNMKTKTLRSEDDMVEVSLEVSMPKEDFQKLLMEVTK